MVNSGDYDVRKMGKQNEGKRIYRRIYFNAMHGVRFYVYRYWFIVPSTVNENTTLGR